MATAPCADVEALGRLQDKAVILITQAEQLHRELRTSLGQCLLATNSQLREQHRSMSDQLASEIYEKTGTIKGILESINSYHDNVNPETIALSEQVHKAVNIQYVELLRNFFITYVKHDQQQKSVVQAQRQALMGDDADTGVVDLEILLQQAVVGQREHAKAALSYVKDRHKDIIKIEHQLLDLKQIMLMMAMLTEAQSKIVVEIEDNVASAAQDVKSGVHNLSRKKK